MRVAGVDWTKKREDTFRYINEAQQGYMVLCPECHCALPMYVCVFELDEEIVDADWVWCTHCGTVFTFWP
jgi:hypothetical protein